jgi:hypothetical protein
MPLYPLDRLPRVETLAVLKCAYLGIYLHLMPSIESTSLGATGDLFRQQLTARGSRSDGRNALPCLFAAIISKGSASACLHSLSEKAFQNQTPAEA